MTESKIILRAYGIVMDANRRVLVCDERIKGWCITKFPGGGLEFGEGLVDCVKREFMEELALELAEVEHFYTTDFFQPSAFNAAHQIISVYYLVKPLPDAYIKTSDKPFDFPECTADALYATDCPGYAAAYKTQQCTANPLYDSTCPGYAAAYLTQQCQANPLYSTTCSGYQQAYYSQQCSLNPLYDTGCPGYQTAYFNQQCDLNGLYDQKCPNYATAYAKKMVLEQQGIASTVATAGVIAQTAPTTTTTVTETFAGNHLNTNIGITVNGIAPGYIATDNTALLRADADRNASILSRIPAGRWGDPKDLAGGFVFLSSPASDYVNGTILTIDGGWMGR